MEYQLKGQLESMKFQTGQQSKIQDMAFRKNLEDMKEDRKDDRVKKQAVEQSKMISQRQGQRGELQEEPDQLSQLLGNQ